ncbi:RnfABCDGE type electron transport complex subunit D [Corallincola luteus]|uniref:Ion-translocating oxidoreductase complex subunit D n=1 Tax=Corallincola luteus TaxID=1775177 RepID=A0ABY2AIE3_9GAMM|nr:RnfABCDGE type electron transport complex subunit D [Corallincola luteus]TCI02445.1 RnfABCDGE type electron transport complex subunit D [Corallincola luteus]
MVQFAAVSGPHSHSNQSTTKLMFLVLFALTPATLYGFYLFGLPAFQVWLVCCVSAVICEAVCLLPQNKTWHSAVDGSAMLTGWLLAMSLPPSTPWWVALSGSLFAIMVGKQIYGGLGQNLFNPAMLARVMLLICFPVELTSWNQTAAPLMTPEGLAFTDSWLGNGIDGVSAATPLAAHSNIGVSAKALLLGNHAGSLGETSAVLLACGGLFLLWRRVISWPLPTALILGLAVPAAIAHLVNPSEYASALTHICSGGAMLAAFFIATDMVTSPASPKGQWVFGIGCGLLIWLIRCFGSYPEGVAFAVLIMNATTPIIDHYLRPKIFGTRSRLSV